jgi:AmmeMemoRadiSam system protein B
MLASGSQQVTRPPAVAGIFYPGDPAQLREVVNRLLSEARRPALPSPLAVIVPHAGYIYSGPIAAEAFATIAGRAEEISRVVLIGPAHWAAVRGIAAPTATHFATPLGKVPIDVESIEALADEGLVVLDEAAHAREHALEVELPFLQLMLSDFLLLPLAVGSTRPEAVGQVLLRLWDERTLVVVSSDLSHYLNDDSAKRRDAATATAIEHLNDEAIGPEDACGFLAVRGLLLAARRRGLKPHRLDLRNSGDTAGDRRRVVGYGAWAILPAGGDGKTERLAE